MYLGGKHGFPLKNEFVQRGPRLCCDTRVFPQEMWQRVCVCVCVCREWRDVVFLLINLWFFTCSFCFCPFLSWAAMRYTSTHTFIYKALFTVYTLWDFMENNSAIIQLKSVQCCFINYDTNLISAVKQLYWRQWCHYWAKTNTWIKLISGSYL